jgi:hypothetical protein
MGLETATYINGLVTTNPTSSDPKSQGDDHLRLVKSTVKATFPNITGAVTPTQADLNVLLNTSALSGLAKLNGASAVTAAAAGTDYIAPGGALGTPSSGTVTNLTGTANITVTGGASGAIAATTLSASSTVSGVGFSTYLASPPAIGGTAAAAVSSTALSYSTTLTGGTGIVNLGSGQFYKDASGNVGIGGTPFDKLDVTGGTTIRGNLSVLANTITQTFTGNVYGAITMDNGTVQLALATNTSLAELRCITNHPLAFYTNNAERMRIDSSGNVTLSTAALLGYGTGSGGTVTQATSKATAVTLNKPTGQITMINAALTASTSVIFALSNTLISATDTVILSHSATGGTANAYITEALTCGAGSVAIRVTNITGGSLSEALVINYAVIKGATS